MRTLLSAEYEDENGYITAVFNAVVELLEKRDSYGVGIKLAGRVIPYGPFYDVRKARKLGGRFASILKVDVFVQELKAPCKLEEPEDI